MTVPGTEEVVVAVLGPSFPYRRSWSFRSPTGFTALGLEPVVSNEEGVRINGILHTANNLASIDKRELGYRRVTVPLEQISLVGPVPGTGVESALAGLVGAEKDVICQVWVYVLEESNCSEAEADYPICQTYLDVVLEGCLEVGGQAMANDFIQSTSGWSEYFLNDTPTSRRPWLHRKRYKEIDALLQAHNNITRVDQRRHPEEFTTEYLSSLRGVWNVPERNHNFIGRDEELEAIKSGFFVGKSSTGTGINQLAATGLGGVGKSQLAIEYCHRCYPRYYGLVVWLNAESAESIAAGMRRLAQDNGVGVRDKQNDEIIEEVKARLYQARCSWLLVFDNLEDVKLVAENIPRGAMNGHVLVTTRRIFPEWQGRSLTLGCFAPDEATLFLHRAAGEAAAVFGPYCDGDSDSKQEPAGAQLARRLGYLPLALGMAASYMQRCDLECAGYLRRLEGRAATISRHAQKLPSFPTSVAGSLELSLDRIVRESPVAKDVLDTVCFLAPDGLSRQMIELITTTICEGAGPQSVGPTVAEGQSSEPREHATYNWTRCLTQGTYLCLGAFGVSHALLNNRRRLVSRNQMLHVGVRFGIAISIGIAAVAATWYNNGFATPPVTVEIDSLSCEKLTTSNVAGDEQADIVWSILKSFSLLEIQGKTASMHRLLQEVLIDSQSSSTKTRLSVLRCLWVLSELWNFQQGDPRSWAAAGRLIEHIRVVTSHAISIGIRHQLCSELLTGAGVFMSVVLSKFTEAERMLQAALEIHREIGDEMTLHCAKIRYHLGQVMRFRGNYSQAETNLLQALQTQQFLLGNQNHQLVAPVLHELGVVKIKQHQLETAESYLMNSLRLKESQRVTDGSHKITDEAATLYQLAVIATISRPPRLDEAEALLRRVLKLGSDGVATQAATLQQLGRVAVRRGELDTAELHFKMALAGYQKAYGADLHINISAVRLQLGNVAMTRRRHADAEQHLNEALRIRRHVYGKAAHPDIAVVLHLLGLNSKANGSLDSAKQHFTEELALLQQLFDSDKCNDRILNMLRDVLVSLRQTAKDTGDRTQYFAYSSQLRELKQLDEDLSANSTDLVHSESFVELVMISLESRSQVRKELRQAVSDKQFVSSDFLLPLIDSLHRATAGTEISCPTERHGRDAIFSFCDKLAVKHAGMTIVVMLQE